MTLPENSPEARRRSPGWVRALEGGDVHALALRLRRKFHDGETSDRELWLLEACISELEYRHRNGLRWGHRVCCCELCVSPFPDDDES